MKATAQQLQMEQRYYSQRWDLRAVVDCLHFDPEDIGTPFGGTGKNR